MGSPRLPVYRPVAKAREAIARRDLAPDPEASAVRRNLRRYGRSVEAFADAVARKHGFPQLEDAWWSKLRTHVRCRQEIIAVVSDTLGLSSPQAGALFGLDHTSVLHLKREYYLHTMLPGMR